MELGEKFERRAVSHRLKTMTYRSKCTMMRAKAEAALRKAEVPACCSSWSSADTLCRMRRRMQRSCITSSHRRNEGEERRGGSGRQAGETES
eukprot:754984-Hanusia_phi.AAC.8